MLARVKGEGAGNPDEAGAFEWYAGGGLQKLDEAESSRRRICRPPLKRAKVNWWSGARRRWCCGVASLLDAREWIRWVSATSAGGFCVDSMGWYVWVGDGGVAMSAEAVFVGDGWFEGRLLVKRGDVGAIRRFNSRRSCSNLVALPNKPVRSKPFRSTLGLPVRLPSSWPPKPELGISSRDVSLFWFAEKSSPLSRASLSPLPLTSKQSFLARRTVPSRAP